MMNSNKNNKNWRKALQLTAHLVFMVIVVITTLGNLLMILEGPMNIKTLVNNCVGYGLFNIIVDINACINIKKNIDNEISKVINNESIETAKSILKDASAISFMLFLLDYEIIQNLNGKIFQVFVVLFGMSGKTYLKGIIPLVIAGLVLFFIVFTKLGELEEESSNQKKPKDYFVENFKQIKKVLLMLKK